MELISTYVSVLFWGREGHYGGLISWGRGGGGGGGLSSCPARPTLLSNLCVCVAKQCI